MGLIFYFNMRR